MNIQTLDIGILAPAFAAGLLILSTHVPLGREVLKRGIIFIDLAIAQIAVLGVIAAQSFGWELHGWEVQLAALSAALTGATILAWMERIWPQVQEAQIGVAFVLAATGGILLLSHNPHGAEQLKSLLIGQILWVDLDGLILPAMLYVATLSIWFVWHRYLQGMGFYLLFAATVTVSVQIVGIYLVFASLIIPALSVRELSGGRALVWGYFIGTAAYGIGLIVSAIYDLPSGPVIVWMLAILGIVLWQLLPRRAMQ